MCGLAYKSTSAEIIAQQKFFGNTFSVINNLLFTSFIYESDYLNFVLDTETLSTNSNLLTVDLGTYDSLGFGKNIILRY